MKYGHYTGHYLVKKGSLKIDDSSSMTDDSYYAISVLPQR